MSHYTSYFGNYHRDFTILSIIDEMDKNGENPRNSVWLDERFYEMFQKGILDEKRLDINFEDVINPLSSELHEAIFKLRANHLIESGSPMKLTEKGRKMLEHFKYKELIRSLVRSGNIGDDSK